MALLEGVLPSWVESDPLRSRAVDALGLQAVADGFADKLLPGLSVLTDRARYFSFLCWAREITGASHNETAIHRCEVTLLLTEAALSKKNKNHQKDCKFVGSRNVSSWTTTNLARVPSDLRTAYETPVWRAYRAPMRELGLLCAGRDYSLSEPDGQKAASLFRNAVHPDGSKTWPLPERACLSKISKGEKDFIRNLLGLDKRGPISDRETDDSTIRRARFAREVRKIYWRAEQNLTPENVLCEYEDRKRKLSEPQNTLRLAAVWEYLSLGLNTLFIGWVRAIKDSRQRASTYENLLRTTRANRDNSIQRLPLPLDDEALISYGRAWLKRALELHNSLKDFVKWPDEHPFLLGCHLFNVKKYGDLALQELFEQHQQAKGDDAWIESNSDGGYQIAPEFEHGWKLPPNVGPHSYRFSAFSGIARDIGGL
jgi:hypothetical protein